MKRVSFLHLLLEILVILGDLIIGVTVLTFMLQGASFGRAFIGAIVLSIGILDFTDFITLKYATKMRSIQYATAAILEIALGAVFIIFNLDTKFICILWGSLSIAFAITKIVTAAINMTHQPLLNTVITILSIIEIVFSILLIIRTLDSLHEHMVFIGIALIVEAVTLLIEFLIHRYQR